MSKEIKKTELTWLIVGGAPRSGTSHMGYCLNQSKDIALFHEYDSHSFFSTVDLLFSETEKIRNISDLNDLNQNFFMNFIPTREKHLKDIVQFIFNCVFDKKTKFIGTKFPGYQSWPLPIYPDWILPCYIHITRNPFDVILSSILKDYKIEDLKPSDVDVLMFHWVSAWNHAVKCADDMNFFHIFYDELITYPKNIEKNLSTFLDGVSDFDLSSFQLMDTRPSYDRFCNANLESYFSLINYIVPENEWIEFAIEKFNKRERFGLPYHWGGEIDLSLDSDGWRYVSGFYPPEFDGSWTKGYLSEILFTPTTQCNGPLQITFEFSWIAGIENLSLEWNLILNEVLIFHGVISKSESYRKNSIYSFFVPFFHSKQFTAVSLKIQIINPINPYQSGLSSDDRELAFMVRNVKFEKLE